MDGWMDVARRPTSERREAPPCLTGNILPWERPVGGDLPNSVTSPFALARRRAPHGALRRVIRASGRRGEAASCLTLLSPREGVTLPKKMWMDET
jgi:hypothetical protein